MDCCVHKFIRPILLWRLSKHSQSDLDILIRFRHPFSIIIIIIPSVIFDEKFATTFLSPLFAEISN